MYGNMNYTGTNVITGSYWSVTDVAGGQPFRVYPANSTEAPTTQVVIIPTTSTTNSLMVYDNASDPTLTVGTSGIVEVSGANNANKFYVQTASNTVLFNVDTSTAGIDLNANTTVTGNLNVSGSISGNITGNISGNVSASTISPKSGTTTLVIANSSGITTMQGNLTVEGAGAINISGSNTTNGETIISGGSSSTYGVTVVIIRGG